MGIFGKKNKKEEKEKKVEPNKTEVKADKEAEVVMPATSLPKGGNADSYGVIVNPHITEKGTMLGEYNKYVFRVTKDSNKIQIKKAIQELYKVKVEKVHVLSARPKSRNIGRYSGTKPGFKKAIVTLKQGDRIEIAA